MNDRKSSTLRPVLINEKNREIIETLLTTVNGKAERHTYHTFEDINALAAEAEDAIEALLVPKTHRTDAKFTSNSGDNLPNNYRHSVRRTKAVLVRRRTGWALKEVSLGSTGTKVSKPTMQIGQAASEAMLREAGKRQGVTLVAGSLVSEMPTGYGPDTA